jgi:hypothetical protein
MDCPGDIAKVAICSLVPDQKGLEAEIREHGGCEENGSNNPDDSKVLGSQQTRQGHRTDRSDEQTADGRDPKDAGAGSPKGEHSTEQLGAEFRRHFRWRGHRASICAV